MAVPTTGFLGLFKPLLNQFSKWGQYYDNNWDALDASASGLSGRMDVVEGVSAQVNADAATVAADKATTIAAKDEAVATKLVASGAATGGAATTLTDTGATMGANAHAGLLIKIYDAGGALKRAEAIVSNTTTQWTFAAGTAIVAGDTYEVYSLGNQSLSSVISVQSDQGFSGNINNPLVDIPLNQIELLPFASGAFTVTSAAADVINYVGMLRTAQITLTAGAIAVNAAGQYATIAGVDYPIVTVAGAVLTLEYDIDLADPVAGDAIISLLRLGGKYAGQITFTRNSRKTYLDLQTGKLRVAPAGFPVFKRRSDGTIGVHVEGVSTNKAAVSGVDTTYWTMVVNMVVTPNAIASPDGTITAHKLVPVSGQVTAYVGRTDAALATIGVNTLSALVKPAELSVFKLGDFGNPVDGYGHAEFALTGAGAVTLQSNVDRAAISKYGSDGWFLCEITRTLTSTVSTQWQVGRLPVGNMGDGVSGFYEAWVQIEPNAFATSRIPTSGTALTRGNDVINLNARGNMFPVQTERTILVDVELDGIIANTPQGFWGTSEGGQFIGKEWSTGKAESWNGSVVSAYTGITILLKGVKYRLAESVNAAGTVHSLYVNAVLENSGITEAGAGPSLAKLTIGSRYNGVYPGFGVFSNFRVFASELTASEIAAA